MKEIPDIQYITRDDTACSHSEQARLMFQNGIKWVQIRMKKASEAEILAEAEKAMDYAGALNGRLIINDSVSIAQKVSAHGLHLGLKDTPVNEAREILGNGIIIGGTANTLEDIRRQVSKGADYVGLGPFRFTSTKENLSPVIGLDGYQKIMGQLRELNISTPIVAVGGLLESDIEPIKSTGIHGVAISGALFSKIIGPTARCPD
ncbi:thiamine phosphate synthase [Marinilabilia rubra]|uniref:Thiamine-phosphate synthase n=1 Tax=Marinilabilia rubra TaxID=2162893 RepID=A0A2U2BBN5_9BACT|nr:thiamine phosphate synthase [Marinilabilia rubra]PWE00476.1 thiamine phosphate synthase [Marinilabilia rubra]